MAFTLQIRKKGFFGNKNIDLKLILKNCNLKYGSSNEFYILQEDVINQNTAVLYNPTRIGRGIFFDGSKAAEGEISLSYNIPTTVAEIVDFVRIVKEVERQLKKVALYCVEEEREYTTQTLEDNIPNMTQFSLQSLHEFCKKEYSTYILTLAMWPFVMNKEQVLEFSECKDLQKFEQLLHDMQAIDAYYAKPTLMQNKADGKILAIYTLTEECVSIFPVKADDFLNLDSIKIDEGLVRFYIFSENQARDGMFSYDRFISYMSEHGARQFDGTHLLIPSITKDEIDHMISEIC